MTDDIERLRSTNAALVKDGGQEVEAGTEWTYQIQYGPEGEANYAWVYRAQEMVATMKTHHARALCSALAKYPSSDRAASEGWQPIETAPKDQDILVWFDHEADTYQCPITPGRLTDYAAWAESGDFMAGNGFCIAKWFPPLWETEDEYGSGYELPAWWFAKQFGDYEYPVNPIYWRPLPAPPEIAEAKGSGQ